MGPLDDIKAAVRAEQQAKLLREAAEILEMKATDEARYRDHPGRDDAYTDMARSRQREAACTMGAEVLWREYRKVLGIDAE